MLIYKINKLTDNEQRDYDSNDRYIYYDRNCIRFQNLHPFPQVQSTGFFSTSTTLQLRLQKNRFPLRISLLLWWNSTTNTRTSERRHFITRNESSNNINRSSNKATNEKEILHILLQSTQTCERIQVSFHQKWTRIWCESCMSTSTFATMRSLWRNRTHTKDVQK